MECNFQCKTLFCAANFTTHPHLFVGIVLCIKPNHEHAYIRLNWSLHALEELIGNTRIVSILAVAQLIVDQKGTKEV